MTMNPASATKQTLLDDLISLWQRRRAEGQSVTPGELCRDRPELLPELLKRVAELEQMADLANDLHETATFDPVVAPRVAPASADVGHEMATVDFTRPAQVATVSAHRPEIPGYEILGELGRGGMGVVYMARQTQLHRLVALKMVLSGGLAGEAELARFRTEAESIARLQHGNIVQIHEVGEYDGRPFFSLEFCAGGSLADKLDGTPLPAEEAARLVETLAQAMEAAHQAHVIHRDLKPGNVLLTADGTPKITDFGLAKKLDVQGQTHTGAVMGTPSYMAPEQAGGQKAIGPAADVYALGAILYELLTGRPPFKAATSLDTIMQVVSDEPVPPRRLQSKVPRDLETICLKCLQKQPPRRYTSAAALAEDLRCFRAGEPIAARPVGRWERGWRWCRRNRMAAGLSAVLLLLLLAVAVGSTVAAIYLNQTSNEARHNSEIAKAQREQARFNQYVAEMNLVQRDYDANNIGRVRELLEAQVPPREADATDFRGFEWHYWQRMAHRELLTLIGHTDTVTGMSFSPDGRRLASAGDSTIRIWDTASGKELLTLKGHTSNVNGMSFSPDGWRLASASNDQTVRIWDADSYHELLILKGHTGAVMGVSFSPDGRRLASAGGDESVRIWDADSGKELFTLKGHTSVVRGVSFSPDGQRLASASQDQTVRIWDAASGKELLTLKGEMGFVTVVSFSPDSRRLATAGGDQSVRIWDVASGKRLLTLWGHTGVVTGVSFSPDGRRMATAGGDRSVRIWNAVSGIELLTLKRAGAVTGVSFSPDSRRLATAGGDRSIRIWDAVSDQELLTLKGHKSAVKGVSFSPDGQRLASASYDQSVSIWDVASGQELLTLMGHTGPVEVVSFSPDGQRLASASWDGTVRIWDAASGRELLTLMGHTGAVKGVSFSPDGQRLASTADSVRIWDAASGKELLTLKGDMGFVTGVSFSPDGQRLASASTDQSVRIWDADSGKELLTLKGHKGEVTGVSFSPDGQRLALVGGDQTVRIWDAASGKELLALKGHNDTVRGVSFSPEGKRLASTSDDQTVRIWDTASGKELLTLKGHTGVVTGVSFSPDGWRLASASDDQTIRIWEALAVPDTVWRQRGLVSQVNSLFERGGFREAVLIALRKDSTLDKADRKFALEVAQHYQRGLVGQVKHLFGKLGLREEVLIALRKDSNLDQADRKYALEVAQHHQEDPRILHEVAWNVVKTRDTSKDAYTRALRQAEAAVRLSPKDGEILNALGIAQYRVGRYADVLETLTRAEKVNAASLGVPHPADLAFLAMTQHQLGKKDASRATLGRLREAMKLPRWYTNAVAVSFQREAEELIEGKK